MQKYIDVIDKLRNEMLTEKDKLEEDIDTDEKYKRFNTLDSVFCNLCNLQLELQVGTNELDSLTDTEKDFRIDEIINGEVEF